MKASAAPDSSAANALITVVACVASVWIAFAAPRSLDAIHGHWGALVTLVFVTFLLQLISVPV